MRIVVVFLIACLWACNPSIQDEVVVTGTLNHYKGDKVYFEIYGQDSIVKADLDSSGNFTARLRIPEAGYVRLMNGKAAFPLYLKPGMSVRLEMDVDKVRQGEYESVMFPGGINKETRMMAHYYENQWFPSTEEMFVYPPDLFRELIDTVVVYNDSIVDYFLAADEIGYDRRFAELFKWQIKVPLAMSYLYYPVYHTLLNPKDSSEIPEDFNIFDKMLPKNDTLVYNRVYRYKTYEVSYWNNVLTGDSENRDTLDAEYLNTYFDRLLALNLYPQIRNDVAHTFLVQLRKSLNPEVKEVIGKRYREVITNPLHIQQMEEWCGLQ